MTNDISTPEEFKTQAKTIRKFMSEKYNIDVSHSHCLELASKISGYADWNTAVAASKSKGRPPTYIVKVWKLMSVLAKFDPYSDIRFWNSHRPDFGKDLADGFKLKEGEYSLNTFSLIADGNKEIGPSFELKLESQRTFDSRGVEFDPLDRVFPHPGDRM